MFRHPMRRLWESLRTFDHHRDCDWAAKVARCEVAYRTTRPVPAPCIKSSISARDA